MYYSKQGYSTRRIVDLLQEEGLRASHRGVAKLVAHVTESGSLARRSGNGCPFKIITKMIQNSNVNSLL
jgi:hypothetical protein